MHAQSSRRSAFPQRARKSIFGVRHNTVAGCALELLQNDVGWVWGVMHHEVTTHQQNTFFRRYWPHRHMALGNKRRIAKRAVSCSIQPYAARSNATTLLKDRPVFAYVADCDIVSAPDQHIIHSMTAIASVLMNV